MTLARVEHDERWYTGSSSVSGSVNGISRAGFVLEEVRCIGTEEGLYACPTSSLGIVVDGTCVGAAAVTCSRGELVLGFFAHSISFCVQCALTGLLGLWKELVTEWAEWRCAETMSGVPSAMKDGMILMPQWLAGLSGFCGVSFVFCIFQNVCESVFSGGTAIEAELTTLGSGLILASGLRCSGNEYTLTECGNDTILSANCTHSRDAGVVCNPGSGVFTLLRHVAPCLTTCVPCSGSDYTEPRIKCDWL